MTKPTIHVFCPGILSWPGSWRSWVGAAVTHCMSKRRVFAEKLEYFSLPSLDRLLRHRRRVNLLKRRLGYYWREGFDIYLVGHSNGCAIIVDAIRELAEMPVKRIDLIAAACEADCELNSINDMLRSGRLGSFHFYIGRKDWPLWFADSFAGWSLGYGTHPLGALGPVNLDVTIPDIETRVVRHVRDDLGHQGFLGGNEFDRTMSMIFGD